MQHCSTVPGLEELSDHFPSWQCVFSFLGLPSERSSSGRPFLPSLLDTQFVPLQGKSRAPGSGWDALSSPCGTWVQLRAQRPCFWAGEGQRTLLVSQDLAMWWPGPSLGPVALSALLLPAGGWAVGSRGRALFVVLPTRIRTGLNLLS